MSTDNENGQVPDLDVEELSKWVAEQHASRLSVSKTIIRHAEQELAQRELKEHWERQKQLKKLDVFLSKRIYFSDIVVASLLSRIMRPSASPPSTILLDLLMKPADALDASINLEEAFALWTAKHGPKRAAWIFRVQTGRVLIGYWFGKALGLAERIVKNFGVLIRPGGS